MDARKPTESEHWNSTAFKKFEFPPSLIAQEAKETKICLTHVQQTKEVQKKYAAMADVAIDTKEKNYWMKKLRQIKAKQLSQSTNQEWVSTFCDWLCGRSKYNSTKLREAVFDEDNNTVSLKEVPGTPWGNKPLTHLPDVQEFLDQATTG